MSKRRTLHIEMEVEDRTSWQGIVEVIRGVLETKLPNTSRVYRLEITEVE